MSAVAQLRNRSLGVLPPLVVLAGAASAGLFVAEPGGIRVALALAGAVALAVAAIRLPVGWMMTGLVVWLTALGTMRRLVSAVSAKEAWGDPLLLVAAAVWVVLGLRAIQNGALGRRTPLTNAVLALAAMMAVSALNPGQGGLSVGLGGALLVVVPMAAFLIARRLVDDRQLRRLLHVVAWMGMAAAVYGLFQTFSGFPSWDQSWIDAEGYTALYVDGVVRAFSSFSAASEYAGFLAVASAAWIALAKGVRRWPQTIAALTLLAAALWYESSRGVIVRALVVIAVMLAARRGLSMRVAAVLCVAALAALPSVIGWVAPEQFGTDATAVLARHQVEGLVDPLGEDSTLPEHIAMVRGGVSSSLRTPLGQGVGTITIAGGKYGGVTAGTEADPGNVPAAVGLPGLIAYGAIVFLGLPRAYGLASRRRDPLSLAALGILAATFLQWFNGGHYAVSFWAWLALGWVDRAASEEVEPRLGSDERLITA